MADLTIAQRIEAIVAKRSTDAPPLSTAMSRGLVLLRWAALAWLCVVVIMSRDDIARPWLLVLLFCLAVAVSAFATWAVEHSSGTLTQRPFVIVEALVTAVLAIAAGWVFRRDAVSNTTALASQWSMAGVLQGGVAYGPWIGVALGVLLGLERMLGAVINGGGSISSGELVAAISTAVAFALAGAVAGRVARLLMVADRAVAVADARQEVARTLHDGVLQTLAVIERRTDDAMLAKMAREQELELREFLLGSGATPEVGGAQTLGPRLRAHAVRYEDRFGGRVATVLAPDLPEMEDQVVEALAGAVGEALTNAGKHGKANEVTVYVEPDDVGIIASVHDNGTGFDTAAVTEGLGMTHSIRGRVESVAGSVEVESRPGYGTEIRIHLP